MARSAAQRAATKRMIAANKAARAGKKRRRKRGTPKVPHARAIAAAGRGNKRAPKRKKHAKAHKVYARNVGERLRSLETRMAKTEKNVAGIGVWAQGVNKAIANIYGQSSRALPRGR